MPDTTGKVVGVLLLCFVLAALSYIAWQYLNPVARTDKRLPVRTGGDSVLRFPERRASGGLAWSKAAYPAEYAPHNISIAEFAPVQGDRGAERYLDIGARAYSREFLDTFSYTEPGKQPRLRVEYLKQSEAFAGRIVGEGLKPNFAYQVKLRGIYSADKDAFERIGKVGRWRLPGVAVNYDDNAYKEYPDKSLVESYLLFDFFVTDGFGRVSKEFYSDSTLHVLWNATSQRRPTIMDSRPRSIARDETNPAYYSNPYVDLTPQLMYAESEQHSQAPNNRPPVGEAFLPEGKYVAEVVLTEESFHGYGDSGFWDTVMSAPVEFEIIDKARPTPYWRSMSEGTPLALNKAELSNLADCRVAPDTLTGDVAGDKALPVITFSEKLDMSKSGRYVLCAELLASGRHEWEIFLDTADFPTEKPTFSVNTEGGSGWQKYAVEITDERACDRLRIAPRTNVGRFGIRNVRICAVAE